MQERTDSLSAKNCKRSVFYFVVWYNDCITNAIKSGTAAFPAAQDYTGEPRLEKQMSRSRRFLLCARGIMIALQMQSNIRWR